MFDVAERRLHRDGEEIDLPPKAFDTLALLVARAGQLVGKDQFVAALWPHTVVSDASLSKIIWQVRRALDDDGERYIQTVPKQGYRFVAAVESPHVAVDTAPAEVQASPITAAPAQAQPGSSRWRIPFALVAIVMLGLLSAYVAWPQRKIAVSASANAGTTGVADGGLVVMPFRLDADATGDRAFADGLADDLIATLARLDGLRVIARSSAGRTSAGDEDLSRLAQQLGVRYALVGALRRDGEALHAQLRLTEIASGEVLWSRNFDRAGTDVFALRREIVEAVSQALALTLSPSLQAELRRSEDPVLYRRYLEARHWLRFDVVDWHRAVADFRVLVADAPGYARAHAGLAMALTQPSYIDAESARTMRIAALAEAQTALKLDANLAEPYTVIADDKCRNAEWEPCIALTQHAIELAPADTTLRLWHARRLTTLGYLTRALDEVRTAYRFDPLSIEVNFMLGHALDTLGRHEEATTYFAAVPFKRQAGIWFNAVWRGDVAAARAATPEDARWQASYTAVLDALQDATKWSAARAAIARSETDGQHANWTRVLDPEPDIAGDIAMLEAIWRHGQSSMSSMLWNEELASHRRDAAFADYVARNRFVDYWRVHGWPDRCRAEEAAVHCD
ncbi:winged helix-turn-helix domain-containing protein [Rudaea cellulosilytica]|uniref:winged helix-turn-helix domain-containing protein n=1 Tax=Rudaea cellulosilytica TaxID=540746 RepID=UPI0003A2E7D5|nr:winged helix-turn-helix domain-containing protein [Rudaea cellulosilytica]